MVVQQKDHCFGVQRCMDGKEKRNRNPDGKIRFQKSENQSESREACSEQDESGAVARSAPTVIIRNTPTPTPAPIWSFTPTPTPRPTPTPIVYPGVSPAPSGETAWCYIPATGEKYHKIPNCGNMNPAKARFILITEAIARGYQKCPKC